MADQLTAGYDSLDRDINKVDGANDDASINLLPELELSMDDQELLDLKNEWVKQWEPYAMELHKKQKENEDYWMGLHFNASNDKRPLVDNLIFEALETFLPLATRQKAVPLVESDNTEAGNALADKVRKMIAYRADQVSYNLKIKQVTRYWALYMLGVIKVGWSMKENDITCVAIRPQKLILDPNATIEEGEYTGYYIGEWLEDRASDLVARFPKKAAFIKDKVKDKMGTTVKYVMWTTNEYVFWTLDNEVLAKNKNPNWNYDQQTQTVDEFGNPVSQSIPGKNHFNTPKKPYVFLSVFNLGKRPFDDTNLIQQNLPLQDLINKRLTQIDKNADNANNSLALSGDAFTQEQAAKAGQAKRKGGTLWVPTGAIDSAVKVLESEHLPDFVYQSLLDYRNELRNIFGTRGSTPQGTVNEQTVRGKLITKGQDADRIGGGIATYLEQFSDNVFNWFVQLMYVYYDEPHVASVIGQERAKEYISLVNTEFTSKLLVGVKEGSMVPHDPVSQRNEAMELWGQKGIDPISFFDRLEFPNPRESAKNLFLWLSDPIALFPDLQQQQMQQQMAAQQQQAQQAQVQQAQQQQSEAQKAQREQQNKLQQIALQKTP